MRVFYPSFIGRLRSSSCFFLILGEVSDINGLALEQVLNVPAGGSFKRITDSNIFNPEVP
jgi:hypothetical protein